MDNPQQNIQDIDLAWLAGFLDGEGSFMVKFLGGRRLKGYADRGLFYTYPWIVLVNTDEPTLGVVQQILDSHHLPYHVSRRIGGVSDTGRKWANSWDIRVGGFQRCLRWCQVLIPYLRTKRSQAEAMLEFCASRQSASWSGPRAGLRKPLSARDIELIEQLRKRPGAVQRLHACTA